MKFNFEKAKDVIKKTVVGSAVVTASLAPMKLIAQENTSDLNTDKTEVNKIVESTPSMDPEFYRNEYIKYMEHPSYKQRLAKEMYGDDIIDEEKQRNINIEYNERMDKIKKIQIFMIPNVKENQHDPSKYSKLNIDSIIEESVKTTPYAANHELSHSVDNINLYGFEEIKNQYINIPEYSIDSIELNKYKKNHQQFIQILNDYIINNKKDISFNIPDGYSWEKEAAFDFVKSLLNVDNGHNFNMDKFQEYFNIKDINIICNDHFQLTEDLRAFEKTKQNIDRKIFIDNYFRQNTEIKARLNHLRIRAIKEFNFNQNDDFDINNYERLREDKQYEELRFNLNSTNEQINELMKYTATNKENNSDTYYHKDWDYNNKEGKA